MLHYKNAPKWVSLHGQDGWLLIFNPLPRNADAQVPGRRLVRARVQHLPGWEVRCVREQLEAWLRICPRCFLMPPGVKLSHPRLTLPPDHRLPPVVVLELLLRVLRRRCALFRKKNGSAIGNDAHLTLWKSESNRD